MQDTTAIKAVSVGRRIASVFLIGAAMTLGGCESIPEVVNPFTWFEDDETAPRPPVASKHGAEAVSQAYPKLGSVPKRPSLQAQQAAIAQGLAADNENARYTDDKIQREVERRAAVVRDGKSIRAVPPPPRVVAPRAQPVLRRASPPALAVKPSVPPVQPAVRPTRASPTAVDRPAPAAPVPVPAFAPGQTVKVATIYFQDGSTKLLGNDKEILREVANAQKQTGSAVHLIGHASGRVRTFDPSRRHMINYQISLNRAHAVAAVLLSLGVAEGKLEVTGKGDTTPIYAEYSTAGEAANRRVELYFVN
ncbi:MAG: hypothetical protein CMM55_16430 [Rhodospirillaceae bacterium]|nr:hypothetical protein [Rhodospirillaceae bacterium]